jgi:hypothetical protein
MTLGIPCVVVESAEETELSNRRKETHISSLSRLWVDLKYAGLMRYTRTCREAHEMAATHLGQCLLPDEEP